MIPDDAAGAALKYHTLGWSVIPVKSGDKRAAIPWTEYQTRRPTDDEILGWFTNGEGVAVVTGSVSGIVVLDIDGAEGEASIAGRALPRTPTVLTGKGRHLYFRHPGRPVPNGVGILPGVDVRGDGGYVVAPPSMHPSGTSYKWSPSLEPGEVSLAPMPDWLAKDARVNGTTKPETENDVIPEGERNDALTRIAGRLRRAGLDTDAIEAALLATNKRCRPPLPTDEVTRIAESVARYQPADLPDEWGLVDLGPILAGESTEAPPSMLLRTDGQGLVYPAKVHVLAGEPESAKGWVALACCTERMGMAEHVLYVDFEDSAATAVARLRALGVSDETIRDQFHYIAPENPLQGDIRLVVPGVTLAVLDGVTEAMTLHGLKMLDNTDVARFLTTFARPLATEGAAVLLLDHVAKDRDTRGRGAIGAQHKLAGVDVSYMVDIVAPFGRGLEGVSRLTVTKDRPGFIRAASAGRKLAGDVKLYSEDNQVAVNVDPATFAGPDPLGLAPATRRVLDALAESPGTSYQQIGDRVVEMGWAAGLHRSTIFKALEELAEMGLADSGEGQWWRVSGESR